MNDFREFWTVPIDQVFEKTGAVNAEGVSDLQEVLDAFKVDLSEKRVLDVGCGTGRLSALCGDYLGADISPSQIEYVIASGVAGVLISGPGDLAERADVVCCFSVFTHIGRGDRENYLRRFVSLAPVLVVDILPSEHEEGGIPAWYANSSEFENDLLAAGYEQFESYDRRSGDGYLHRYYLAW